MAFTWSVSECNENNIKDVHPTDQDRIAWGCLELGMSGITFKNYKEFYRRMRLYGELFNIYKGLTVKDIFNCIGLVTSAPNLVRGAWHRQAISQFNYQVEREIACGRIP